MTEPFAYIAGWTKKRSTTRLQISCTATAKIECECDGYAGFECGKHRRVEEIRWALDARNARTGRTGQSVSQTCS